MTFTFKSNCPQCGGTKKLNTSVDLFSKTLSSFKTKCHKCGYSLPAFVVEDRALNMIWFVPE